MGFNYLLYVLLMPSSISVSIQSYLYVLFSSVYQLPTISYSYSYLLGYCDPLLLIVGFVIFRLELELLGSNVVAKVVLL